MISRSSWSPLILLIAIALSQLGTAAATPLQTSTDENSSTEQSTWLSIQKKLRVRNFTEFMTPALSGSSTSFPDFDSTGVQPTNLYNILAVDYEIAPNYRILYHQRAFLFLGSDQQIRGMSLFARDPRFALRRTQIFDVPNLNTSYDFFLQLGISNNQISTGNRVELGIRTNTNYSLPGSRWTFGLIQEFTSAYLDAGGTGNRAYGFFMPWLSYDLSPKWSLQHYSSLSFVNSRNASWVGYQWDTPRPFMQNGVNFNITNSTSVSLFLNNYYATTPRLGNSWVSVWLNMDLI